MGGRGSLCLFCWSVCTEVSRGMGFRFFREAGRKCRSLFLFGGREGVFNIIVCLDGGDGFGDVLKVIIIQSCGRKKVRGIGRVGGERAAAGEGSALLIAEDGRNDIREIA